MQGDVYVLPSGAAWYFVALPAPVHIVPNTTDAGVAHGPSVPAAVSAYVRSRTGCCKAGPRHQTAEAQPATGSPVHGWMPGPPSVNATRQPWRHRPPTGPRGPSTQLLEIFRPPGDFPTTKFLFYVGPSQNESFGSAATLTFSASIFFPSLTHQSLSPYNLYPKGL
jgi:hypothetical protein